MSVAQQIKERIDIVDYINQYVPDLKRAGRYYKACCPFHNEKTPSFVVNPDTQTWRCFGACAEGGDVFTFAQKYQGWTFREALQELAGKAGVELRKQTPEQRAEDERLERLRGLLKTAAEYYHKHLMSDRDDVQAVRRYAHEKRGFSAETLQQFQIGYAPDHWDVMLGALRRLGYEDDEIVTVGLASRNDKGRVYDRFRNRLMIPIRDDRGRVVGFGARALSDEDNPKYLNSPQTPLFDKSHLLFGLDMAKRGIRENGIAVIVEGYMDVVQAHQAGFTNMVAQMGTAMTETQLKLLVPRYASKIIMALDSDAAGQSATRRSLEVARRALQADYTGKMSVDIRILQLDGAKDPDDVLRETPDRWQQYMDTAMPVADFVIKLETAELRDDATIPERQAVARRVLPILAASENDLYRQENLQKLALRLRIPTEDLIAWARQVKQQESQRQSRNAQPAAPPPPAASDPAPPARPPQALQGYHSSRAAEAHCLKMLLQTPELLYQANRKLRELGKDEPELWDGPLSAIDGRDFSHSDYRVVMDILLEAMQQDELDPYDYLHDQLDENLLEEVDRLLLDESLEVQQFIQFAWHGDLDIIWQQYHRRRPSNALQHDVLNRILSIRQQRLKRERQELQLLVQEAFQNTDHATVSHLSHLVKPAIRASHLIEMELQRAMPIF